MPREANIARLEKRIGGLHEITRAVAEGKAIKDQLDEPLKKVLEDLDPLVRQNHGKSPELLASVSKVVRDARIHHVVGQAMGAGNEAACRILLENSRHENREVRQDAVPNLGAGISIARENNNLHKISAGNAIGRLCEMVDHDPDGRLVFSVCSTLIHNGCSGKVLDPLGERALNTILKAAKSEKPAAAAGKPDQDAAEKKTAR